MLDLNVIEIDITTFQGTNFKCTLLNLGFFL